MDFPTQRPTSTSDWSRAGIGQTPFLAYARELLGQKGYGGRPPRASVKRVSFYYGVRSADLAAGVEDFRQAGAAIHLATDDGSLGFRGFVTQLLEKHPPPAHLVGCGPEPMMRALSTLASRWGVPCHLSLETPMACGLGICFSCVTRVRITSSNVTSSHDLTRTLLSGQPVGTSPRTRFGLVSIGIIVGCAWTGRCSMPPPSCGKTEAPGTERMLGCQSHRFSARMEPLRGACRIMKSGRNSSRWRRRSLGPSPGRIT